MSCSMTICGNILPISATSSRVRSKRRSVSGSISPSVNDPFAMTGAISHASSASDASPVARQSHTAAATASSSKLFMRALPFLPSFIDVSDIVVLKSVRKSEKSPPS